jgi:hypothetical protein
VYWETALSLLDKPAVAPGGEFVADIFTTKNTIKKGGRPTSTVENLGEQRKGAGMRTRGTRESEEKTRMYRRGFHGRVVCCVNPVF